VFDVNSRERGNLQGITFPYSTLAWLGSTRESLTTLEQAETAYMAPIRVLVVDDHEVARRGIILLDITLPGMSGIQAARRIRVVSPDSRIIFLSQHDSVSIAKDALSAGAQGYVVKSDAGLDLLTAIQAVHEGREFVSRTLVARGWN